MTKFYLVKSLYGRDTDIFETIEEAKAFIDSYRQRYQEGLIANDGNCKLYELTPIPY